MQTAVMQRIILIGPEAKAPLFRSVRLELLRQRDDSLKVQLMVWPYDADHLRVVGKTPLEFTQVHAFISSDNRALEDWSGRSGLPRRSGPTAPSWPLAFLRSRPTQRPPSWPLAVGGKNLAALYALTPGTEQDRPPRR